VDIIEKSRSTRTNTMQSFPLLVSKGVRSIRVGKRNRDKKCSETIVDFVIMHTHCTLSNSATALHY
jgi:hypothetical protein